MKKIALLLTVLTLSLTAAMPAFAVDNVVTTPGEAGSVPVTVSIAAPRFDVTVPMSLPLTVDQDGVVTAATAAKIVNNGFGSVKVSAITVAPASGWEVVDFGTDMGSIPVNSSKFGFKLNQDTAAAGTGVVTLTSANWPAIAGKNATDTDELTVAYTGVFPARSTALTGEQTGTVQFTIGWNTL